ncbi:MAG: hypothetical protein V4465_01165 [Patescibacteria group bacterium]
MSKFIWWCLDNVLADLKFWRKYRGGRWYRVRDNMHPASDSWGRYPATSGWEETWQTESYPDTAPLA